MLLVSSPALIFVLCPCILQELTPVAYQTTAPPAGSGPFLYILKGAMTELQGRIPPDAFDEEERLGEGENRERKRKAVK